jgi:hypothetical protein
LPGVDDGTLGSGGVVVELDARRDSFDCHGDVVVMVSNEGEGIYCWLMEVLVSEEG